MGKFMDLKYKLVENPPYSPDLSLSDFHLFLNLKKFETEKRFGSNNEVMAVVNGYFKDFPELHLRNGIQ